MESIPRHNAKSPAPRGRAGRPLKPPPPSMNTDASKTLDILFSMDPSEIRRDLRRAEEDIEPMASEFLSLLALPLAQQTPETDARVAHLLMVQSHELCRRDAVPPEIKTFHSAASAANIAEYAETVSAGKGTCAQLSARMDLILRRQDLATHEFRAPDEAPPDYRELSDEFARMLARVADTVSVFVLRRYRLDEQADLFERDRMAFDLQREVGRRVAFPPAKDSEDSDTLMDDYIKVHYGAKLLRQVRSRVKELRDREGPR